ncbi:MAG: hypothetical protein D6784_10465 [Chloroflexi bacterium]|nr:MAG: hypothetical protein D6784_10465 [Chloroflexota bacterium]
MSKKRAKKPFPGQKESPRKQTAWQKWLVIIPLTPLAAGLLLIFSAVLDVVVWISPPAQALLGGLLVLGSFVLLNAVQKQWTLAAGWLLFGVGFWLWINWSGTWVRGTAYLAGGLGLYLIGVEFARRYKAQRPAGKSRAR